jgi:hypothetical protein
MEDNIQTTEDLAELIQRIMASKEDIRELREEMTNGLKRWMLG